MAEKKIIHLAFRGYNGFFYEKEDSRFYLGTWAALQAEAMAKYTNEIKQEVWRPDFEIKRKKCSIVNGVKCKLFPYSKFCKKYSLNPLSLIIELKKECKKNYVIINLHYMHCIASMIVILLFQRYSIVIHHHGNIPIRYKKRKGFKKVLNLLLSKMDEYFLKKVDYFSVISKLEKDYIERITNTKNIVVEQGRKYYHEWKPIDKITARKKIGLPINKKIIIYVGYYYKLKGVDTLLEIYNKLKSEYDIFLIMIGGSPKDELYEDVKESGALELGRVPNKELIIYFSASDIYVMFSCDENLKKFGGLGTAPIEALACNIPIVSSQLIHFPENNRKKVGEIPQNKKDLYLLIKKIFNNPKNYSPRIYSKPYYDFAEIIRKNTIIYKKLFNNASLNN